jgi:hypothetical protein
MIYDRNPLIPITSDKVRVRDYVKKVLGKNEAENILIPVYHISKTGKDIPHQSWDFEFFMKANHYSGGNMLVKPGEDPKLIRSTCEKWLKSSFGQAHHAWAYRDIPRKIICEKVLREKNGKIPADIKYYCFNGLPKMIMIFSDRFEEQKRIFLDENLNEIEGAQMYGKKKLWPIPEIPNHQRMIELSKKLSQPFTYCRVDFYSIGDRVYFGELTHYTGAGIESFDDFDVDLAFGKLWLPENKNKGALEMIAQVKSSEREYEG